MIRVLEEYDCMGEVCVDSVDNLTVDQVFDLCDLLQLLIDAGVIPDESYTIYATEHRLREALRRQNRHNRRRR